MPSVSKRKAFFVHRLRVTSPEIPAAVNGDDVISDDAADALADFLLDRWFAKQTQPLRDADPCESDARSTEAAS